MRTPEQVTLAFYDHASLWTGSDDDAGHTTDGGRVFGITRRRYVECDRYKCPVVVVIYPDDRAQVEALANEYAALSSGFAELQDEPWTLPAMRMRQALRALANPRPPKPDEPTGLGAVVEAINDNYFVRVNGDEMGWARSGKNADACLYVWADIAAVRVLSEGVA